TSRKRLVRRGDVIGSSLTQHALMLGTGLATAQPQAPSVPGVNPSGPDNGAKIDPSALATLRNTTTTSTTSRTTPTTKKGSKPTVASTSTSTTTTTKPAETGHVLGIGDSVMEGARSSLVADIPGMAVDAIRSRQFTQAITVVGLYKAAGLLPRDIVLHLGTNGRITDSMFDQMMQTVGPGHRVYFLTARVPRLWESEVNNTLHSGATRWANAHVLEWRTFSGCHDDWFVSDGFHLRTQGQHAYAMFVLSGLRGKAPTTCTK
ncbi:MAG: hypothetical protein QOG65_1712, partial [Actinomycetota bacterium]|nr:hypothetical protein [Actinomycetota bacterium]